MKFDILTKFELIFKIDYLITKILTNFQNVNKLITHVYENIDKFDNEIYVCLIFFKIN